MRSPAFEVFVAPARRHPQLWRLALGVLVAVAVFLLYNAGLFVLVARSGITGDAGSALAALARPDTPVAVMVLLAGFGGMILAAVAAAALHRRGPASLIGPDMARAARDFGIAALIVWAFYLPALGAWSLYFDSEPGLDPALWWRLLPFILVGLLVQTGAEELLFRGYLTQQLAARFRSPIIWLLIPALLFGLLHFDPAKGGANTWLMVAAATLFGLLAADLTRVSGSLGAAWGFHFANNLAAISLLSTKGTITGAALRLTPYAADDPQLILPLTLGDLSIMALAWLSLRACLRRRAFAG